MMWYWGGGGVHWWGWLLGAIAMVVFWSLVVWAIWYLVTTLVRRPDSDRRADDPKRILDERLARGDIDAEEYRRLRDLMTGQPGQADRGAQPAGTSDRP